MLTGSPRFKVDRLGKFSILHVIGNVDEANSCNLEIAMREAARECDGQLIVAFVECNYAAATCLNVLMRQFKLLASRLSVVAPVKSHVRRHFDLMPFGSVPPVHDSFREAILAICRANETDRATHSVEPQETVRESALAG